MPTPVVRGRRLLSAIDRLAKIGATRARDGTTHDAADDDVGTFATDDALAFDPVPLLRAFARVAAPVVVIGQVAGILHGSAELTGDLDLLWSGDAAEAGAVYTAFASLHAELTDDDGGPLPLAPSSFALAKVQFRVASAAGDCCTPRLPWGALDVGTYIDRALSADVDGVTVRYLALDDLIAMRHVVARPKDRRRAAELEAIARSRTG